VGDAACHLFEHRPGALEIQKESLDLVKRHPFDLALVRIPVFALTQISLMPGGARNGISGLPASALLTFVTYAL